MNCLSNGGCHIAGSLFHVPLPAVVADVHRASCSPASVAAHGETAIPRYREGWEENNWRIWEYLRLMGECLMEHDRIISGYICYINLYLMIIWWIFLWDIAGKTMKKTIWIYIYIYIYIYTYWNITIQLDMMYPCWSSRNFWGSMPGGWGGYSWDPYGWFDPTLLFHTDYFWRRESLRLVQESIKYNKYTKVQQEVDRNLWCIFPCVVPWLSLRFPQGLQRTSG